MFAPAKRALKAAVAKTPLPELRLRSRARQVLTVLTYHRVLNKDSGYPVFDEGVISGSPSNFARDIGFCRRHFDVVNVDDVYCALEGGSPLPKRPLLLTFDDAYIDNYEIVFPILRDQGISGTFFLPTQFVGTSAMPWWDRVACCLARSRSAVLPSPFYEEDPPYRLEAQNLAASTSRFLKNFKRTAYNKGWEAAELHLSTLESATGVEPTSFLHSPLFLNWSQAQEMVSGGMCIGGHTRSHPILSTVTTAERLRSEIIGCHEDLIANGFKNPVPFAYPVGSIEAMSKAADTEIEAAGFRISFAHNHASTLLSGLRRSRVSRLKASCDSDLAGFRLMLARNPIEPTLQT